LLLRTLSSESAKASPARSRTERSATESAFILCLK
jgi:hypothetical protein